MAGSPYVPDAKKYNPDDFERVEGARLAEFEREHAEREAQQFGRYA